MTLSSITVLLSTWAAAFDCPGGGEIQLLKYEEQLSKLGVRVLRYNMWNPRPQFDAADIVHFFSVQGGSWRLPIYARDVHHIPVIISPIIWLDKPEKYALNEINHFLRIADHILPNSRKECAQLSNFFNISYDRFTPIVNGVDKIFFELENPFLFKKTFNLSAPFVLCMGNIEARKNQLLLIAALAGTGLHLVLAGQEREMEYAEKCRAQADATVHFVGELEHGSSLQRSAYAAAELLCLPSTLETPGLAALEAAATGCRLALTREGCTEEYFGTFATYCDPENVESIRLAIQIAMAKPRSATLPNFIRENYTWTRAAEQIISVYRSILNK
jgi:glycosyltransferase involved in cell wall biosynthesis